MAKHKNQKKSGYQHSPNSEMHKTPNKKADCDSGKSENLNCDISTENGTESFGELSHQRSPEFVLFESQQSELCYEELSPEIMPRVPRLKLQLHTPEKDVEHENEASRMCKSKSMQFKKFDPKLLDDDDKECNVPMTITNSFPLDRTLSMTDEIKLEMNVCESIHDSKSLSKTGVDTCTFGDFQSSRSSYLPYKYVSEPTQFQTFNTNNDSQSQGSFNVGLSEFQSTISTFDSDDFFRKENEKQGFDKKWNSLHPHDSKCEIINENVSQETRTNIFTKNWNECKRIFSTLQQLHALKARNSIKCNTKEYIADLLTKYKKLNDEAQSLHASVSTSSYSCYTPTSSRSRENSNSHGNKRPFTENDKVNGNRNAQETDNNLRIEARSTTPCRGSPPPAKRCRTTLKFVDEEDVENSEELIATVKVADLLPIEKKKDTDDFFYPNATMYEKSHWSSPNSPVTSIFDLPMVSDSGDCNHSLQEIERANEQTSFLRNRRKTKFRFSRGPVVHIALFCISVMRKLQNLFINVREDSLLNH